MLRKVDDADEGPRARWSRAPGISLSQLRAKKASLSEKACLRSLAIAAAAMSSPLSAEDGDVGDARVICAELSFWGFLANQGALCFW